MSALQKQSLRAARLAPKSALQEQRLTTESAEERTARLTRMSALQKQRLTMETEDVCGVVMTNKCQSCTLLARKSVTGVAGNGEDIP